MMDFKEFSERMETDLKTVLAVASPGTNVEMRDVEKMQGQSYTALTVSPQESGIGANINLNRLYGQMEMDADYDRALDNAVTQAKDFLENAPQFNVADLTDYEQSRSKLFVEVVSAERNADMLEKVPHVQIEDMAMVYRLQVGKGNEGIATTLVSNELLQQFGVSAEQLHQDALANSVDLKPAKVETLAGVIAELTGMPREMLEGSTPPVYVVSNEERMKGASVLFYPEVMDQLKDQIGGDYFVLPSSVHEVLVMPDTGMENAEELKAMVTSINGDVVEPEDVLTDQVYHYDSKDRIFELGEKFEARQAEKEAEKSERTSVLKDLKEKQKDLPPITAGSKAKNKTDPEL